MQTIFFSQHFALGTDMTFSGSFRLTQFSFPNSTLSGRLFMSLRDKEVELNGLNCCDK